MPCQFVPKQLTCKRQINGLNIWLQKWQIRSSSLTKKMTQSRPHRRRPIKPLSYTLWRLWILWQTILSGWIEPLHRSSEKFKMEHIISNILMIESIQAREYRRSKQINEQFGTNWKRKQVNLAEDLDKVFDVGMVVIWKRKIVRPCSSIIPMQPVSWRQWVMIIWMRKVDQCTLKGCYIGKWHDQKRYMAWNDKCLISRIYWNIEIHIGTCDARSMSLNLS